MCMLVGVVSDSAATVAPLLEDLLALQQGAPQALLGSLDVVLAENKHGEHVHGGEPPGARCMQCTQRAGIKRVCCHKCFAMQCVLHACVGRVNQLQICLVIRTCSSGTMQAGDKLARHLTESQL